MLFLFTKIGQMPLVESRDRHADGDLKIFWANLKTHKKSFNFFCLSIKVLMIMIFIELISTK